jgi:MFS family permease
MVVWPPSMRALNKRNFRWYFLAQVFSICGMWAQMVGLAWLVLDLSDDSGVAAGVVTALQAAPVLLFGLWAGLLADRFDKRRFILLTQTALATTAGVLAVLDLTGVVELWMVFVLAFLFGTANAGDLPARLSFVVEMVGPDDLPNAIALNSAMNNGARMVGPAIAAAVIATGGTGYCFLINAVSYVGTIVAVATMRRSELQQPTPVARGKGQVREGIVYAWRQPVLRATLLTLALTSLLAFNYPVVLPLLAKLTFDGDAGTYSLMASAMGFGAFVVAVVLARIGRPYGRRVLFAVIAVGVSTLLASAAPSLLAFVALLPFIGAAQIVTASSANALIQLDAASAMRGRMTSLFSLTASGVTPLGGMIAGTVVELFGPRAGMAVGGVGALAAAALVGMPLLAHRPAEVPVAEPALPV